jgi:hypothetical protein
MKTSKFSESQIAYILRQAEEGTAIGEVCRSAGISKATFYNWRKKYGGLLRTHLCGKMQKLGRTLLHPWHSKCKHSSSFGGLRV